SLYNEMTSPALLLVADQDQRGRHISPLMQHISFIAELDHLMHTVSFPISCLPVSVRM
ncbi:hypothetical protein KUCAC02_014632, partial [Chaenocephalus aceratus]